MLEIIPISKREEDVDVDTDKKFYIDNSIGDSIAKKYNYAIENIVLKSNEQNICFRHKDSYIAVPYDIVEYKLTKRFENYRIGICGLIGTSALDKTCTWWSGVASAGGRKTYGEGAIIQGDITNNCGLVEYPMVEHPGVYDYLATVDGCCMFFPRRVFEEGLRFDETLTDYHFYDTDICLQLLERGYKVSTIDLKVKHYSVGKPPANFEDLRKVFFAKWDKKVHGEWPISRLSKFYKD